MAVLAPNDWQPPREQTMDSTSPSGASPSGSRPRASPANDGGSSPAPAPAVNGQGGAGPGQPYPFQPGQQQWTPSPTAQPFYPQFYPHQNGQGPPPPGPPQGPGGGPAMHGAQPMPYMHPSMQTGPMAGPYYDPNAQFAQWYHHMMLSAQQQAHMGQFPPQQMPMQGYPFQGAPPQPAPNFMVPPASRSNSNSNSHNSEYGGFHPYRRPTRGQSQDSLHSQPSTPVSFPGGPPGGPQVFQPPYARADASGSSSSVGSRPRTDSNRSANSNPGAGAPRRSPAPPPPVPTPPPGRTATPPSSTTRTATPPVAARTATPPAASRTATPPAVGKTAAPAAAPTPPKAHARTSSMVSAATSSSSKPASAAAPAPAAAAAAPAARVPRPSPLSQGGEMSKSEKRMSRDDSDLAALRDPTSGARSAGLKGRLRRAFTALQEEPEPVTSASTSTPTNKAGGPTPIQRSASTPAIVDMGDGDTTPGGKKKRALFNTKFNRSTDNISISSVSSSASVMIRKLGSFGKIARRNSIAGLTSLFKDKDKDKDGGEDKKDKKKDKDKKGKGEAADPKVSHVTAELDAGEWSAEMSGLSPAARLARQHTLKSNAEAAARAQTEKDAAAAAAAAALAEKEHANGVPVWDRNTATRAQAAEGARRVGEDGRAPGDDGSDDGSEDGTYRGEHDYGADAWDEPGEDSWDTVDPEEADTTIRLAVAPDDGARAPGPADEGWPGDEEPWAVGLRRSVERTAVPLRGILKNAAGYNQAAFLEQAAGALTNRARSNSYGGMPTMAEPGPLARIPSPDPDHIDGLHRHGSHSSGGHAGPAHGTAETPFLPAFAFEGAAAAAPAPAPLTPEKALYSLPNSSAPTLSAFAGAGAAPPLAQRAVTAPPKKLAFASNLSVYDTFPPTLYDRRSEPATASRLTPALAQRIKEELNSFKMEEMEVHAASRIHTQFFV